MGTRVSRKFSRLYKQLFTHLLDELKRWKWTGWENSNLVKILLNQIAVLYFLPGQNGSEASLGQKWRTGDRNFLTQFFKQEIIPIPGISGDQWFQALLALPEDILTNLFTAFDCYRFRLKEQEPASDVEVTPEILGQAFEGLQEMDDRKSKGVFYTPTAIVNYMCQESLLHNLQGIFISASDIFLAELVSLIRQPNWQPDWSATQIPAQAQTLDKTLANLKICDPAIGSGAFAVGMLEILARTRMRLTPFLESAHRDSRTATDFKLQALRSSIFGMDIDPAAVYMARCQLWLSLKKDWSLDSHYPPLCHLDRQIAWGNFLLPSQEFDIRTHFNSVFEFQSGFDIVIGNPPYVRIHKQEQTTKKRMKQLFVSAYRDYDIYILFFEQGISLLKENGILAYITPDKFLTRTYGEKIRRLLLSYSILELFDISRIKETFAVAAYPLISIVQKNSQTPLIQTKFADSLEDLHHPQTTTISKNDCFSKNLIELIDPDCDRLLSRIYQQSQPLREFIDRNQLFCGTPRARDYHKWRNYIFPKLELADNEQSQNNLRVLVCRNLKPYRIESGKRVQVVGAAIVEPYFCRTDNTISAQRWQDFCYAPKILIRGNDTRITAVLENQGSVFIGIYALKICGKIAENYKYLLGLLNSSLYQWIFAVQNQSLRISGGFFSINAPQILRLPFKIIQPDRQIALTNLVDQILLITQTERYPLSPEEQTLIQSYRQQIDQLIYAAYDLSSAEIAIVREFN